MMAKPRKNISREIRDIRFPTSHIPEKPPASDMPLRKVQPMPAPGPRKPIVRRRRFPWRLVAAFACLALLTAVAASILWYRHKAAQASRLREVLNQSDNLPIPLPDISSLLGNSISMIKDIFSNYGGLERSSLQAINALDRVGILLQEVPARFLAKDGPGLVTDLTSIRDSLQSLGGFLRDVAAKGEGPAILPGISKYASYAADVDRAQAAVERLLVLLQSPGEHHLLVLFGNSAELRPGGGFLGSYADLTFGSSTIGEVVVRDVNEADRGLAANIVPPKPLQGLVTRWRAADANWFFDYPKSAQKTLEIMGRSSLYASGKLEGAILISPKVIQDLLAATGPITLDDGRTIAADTVIPMIQREVQSGQASGAENPKEILSKLLPPLQSKLQNLDADALQKLAASAREWLRNRDAAIFMADPELSRILSYYQADGGSYAIPQNFSGDYFAAVNANVGGGKSDARIEDTVDLESDLRADGVIENHVTVVRESSATGADEWWYRVTNQDYLQVFTPADITLTAASGGSARFIAPRADYSQGFETDRDLAELESTLRPAPGFPAISQFRELDKNVFATWLTTPAGGSGTVRFAYRRALKAPFHDGDGYTFVFERQSGSRQSLHVVLNAPPGFVWQENSLSEYEYFTEATPGRVMLNLTLKAI